MKMISTLKEEDKTSPINPDGEVCPGATQVAAAATVYFRQQQQQRVVGDWFRRDAIHHPHT